MWSTTCTFLHTVMVAVRTTLKFVDPLFVKVTTPLLFLCSRRLGTRRFCHSARLCSTTINYMQYKLLYTWMPHLYVRPRPRVCHTPHLDGSVGTRPGQKAKYRDCPGENGTVGNYGCMSGEGECWQYCEDFPVCDTQAKLSNLSLRVLTYDRSGCDSKRSFSISFAFVVSSTKCT